MTLVSNRDPISPSELEAVIEASADVMFKISETGKILGCKVGKFADPLWNADELLGKEVEDTILSNNAVSFTKAIRTVVKAQNTQKLEYLVQIPDTQKWYEVRMVPADNQEVLAVFKDITTQKKAQEEKQHTEVLFKAIFDNTYQFTALLLPDGTLLHINKTALDFGGIALNEIKNKPFWDAPWWNVPENHPLRLRAAVRSAAGDNFVRYETPVRGGDGKIYYLDFSLKPIKDSNNEVLFLIAEGRDITERRKIEEELARTEKMYRTIVQNIPRGMLLVMDRNMRFSLADGEMIEVMGYRKDEVEGKTLREFTTNEEVYNLLYTNYRAGLEGKSNVFEFSSADGRAFYHVIVRPIIKSNQEIDEILILVYDVLEQKKMAAELEKNLNELQATVKMLQHKNEQLEQFAYISSHDLQEPLRMVVSYTQLLEQKFGRTIDAEAKEFMGYAREGAQRMQRIIYDLMLYNELDNNKCSPQKINVNHAVKAAMHKLLPEIEASKAQINCSVQTTVFADAKEFMLVLENLLANAIKFVMPGKTPQIEVGVNETNENWILTVKDNGLGIQKNHFSRIFNIFQRLHTRDQFTGSGIGLAICKKIAERHNGHIWVESTENEGSTFYFSLPKISLN